MSPEQIATLVTAGVALVGVLISMYNARNGARKDAVSYLQTETSRAHERLQKIEAERDELRDERLKLIDRIESLEDEREALSKEKIELNAHVNAQDAVVVQYAQKAQNLEQTVTELRIIKGDLLERFDKVGKQLSALELENGALKYNNSQLQAQLDERVKEIEKLNARTSDLENKATNGNNSVVDRKAV